MLTKINHCKNILTGIANYSQGFEKINTIFLQHPSMLHHEQSSLPPLDRRSKATTESMKNPEWL
jgi:hypothetical protein